MLLKSPPPGFAPDRTFFVALKGGDADNIADALVKVNALTPAPSAAAPAAIMVFPGVYATPPFTIPAYVTIIGATQAATITLVAATTTAQLATLSSSSALMGVSLMGANGVGGVGVGYRAGAAGNAQLEHVSIISCETGVYVDGATRSISLSSVQCIGCTNSYRIGSSGGSLRGFAILAVNDVVGAKHLWVETNAGIVSFGSSYLRDDKFDVAAGALVQVLHMSTTPGEESIRALSEFQVGSEVQPKESCFGGGDSHTRNMAVYTNTNLEVGTWADITGSLILLDASSANLFAGVAAGNCVYVGGDLKFPGIKATITTAMALGTGEVVVEIWNGSAWVSIYHMSADSNTPYNQYALAIFQRVNDEHIRFEKTALATWATKSLNGTTKYWARVRVVTAITTIPACDKMKVHTHRTEINADGRVEHFGDAEPTRELLWHRKLGELWDGNDPGDQKILVGVGVTIGGIDNKFQDGGKDGVLSVVRVQGGLDTSRELTFQVGWHPEPGKVLTGFVELEVAGYVFKPGDRFNGTKTPIFTASVIVNMSTFAFADALKVTSIPFRIPDRVPGDVLVIHFFRDGTPANLDDTYDDHAMIIYTEIDGVFWRD